MPSPSTPSAAEVAQIRSLALVGPAAAGKTSLVEALLFKSGAITEFQWSVDGKNLIFMRYDVQSDIVLITNFR